MFCQFFVKSEVYLYKMRVSWVLTKRIFLSCSILLSFMFLFNLRREEDFESDVTIRVKIMQEACKHHGLDKRGEDSLHQPYSWEYLIAKEKNTTLVWCNIFKSGSSR